MALKPDRDYNAHDDITHFWVSSETIDRQPGGIASLVTEGSGVAMDNAVNVVSYVADPSGAAPKGILTAPVKVYADANWLHRKFDNGEVLPGEKVCLIRKGWMVTDLITGTPAANGVAYLGESGYIRAVQLDDGQCPTVGKFETTKDENGFARVYVDL